MLDAGAVRGADEPARRSRRETTVVWYGDRHSSYAIRGLLDDGLLPASGRVLRARRRPRALDRRRPPDDVRGHRRHPPATYPVPTASNDREPGDMAGRPRRHRRTQARSCSTCDRARSTTGSTVRAARGGHIPGAVHIEWTEATAGDNVLKPDRRAARACTKSQGVTPDKDVITHCQLGIRAAHTWFVLKHVLGYPNVRNYDGSWQEWGNRDGLADRGEVQSPARSVRVDLAQAVVADAEVVRDLVPDDVRARARGGRPRRARVAAAAAGRRRCGRAAPCCSRAPRRVSGTPR